MNVAMGQRQPRESSPEDAGYQRRCPRCEGRMRRAAQYRLGTEVERLADCGEDWTCNRCRHEIFLPTWRSIFLGALAGVIALVVGTIPFFYLIPDSGRVEMGEIARFLFAMFMTFAIAAAVLIYGALQGLRGIRGIVSRLRAPPL